MDTLALLYRATGRVQEAEQLYEAALPITREAGNRAEELPIIPMGGSSPGFGVALRHRSVAGATQVVSEREEPIALLWGLV